MGSTSDCHRSGRHSTSGEQIPLLNHHLSISERNGAFEEEDHRLDLSRDGSASTIETMMNIAKTCMGTGCLALPVATKQGGVLLHVFGILCIALWNVFSAHRLSECWDLLTRKEYGRNGCSLMELSQLPPPPRGTATLGKVAWYALGGRTGILIVDTLTVILMFGIIVSYIDAIRTFLEGTPLTTHSQVLDAIVVAVMVAPLSIVPDLGYLTKTSAAGLSVLGVTLVVVGIYGYQSLGDDEEVTGHINLLPRDGMAGISQWFGCIVFGFGIVPLTFNFRESMAEPAKLSMTITVALLFVAMTYIVIGLTLLTLYPEITSDVLSELPTEGLIPGLTRLSMVVVVLATAPLLIVPCGQIIEGKMTQIPQREEVDYHKNLHRHRRMQVAVRLGICFLTVAISVAVPEFVGVLTFVGCFCVAFVNFCIPPFLHLLIRISQGETSWTYLWIDTLFLAWGLVATGISTMFVFRHSIMGNKDI